MIEAKAYKPRTLDDMARGHTAVSADGCGEAASS